ncbi:MAG: exodeoxyribonuclease VII large subunit, partial [Pseudomonadota bacterium]
SSIPLISAVGHETDTTLIDLASDLRAPTPTAAAELAVPVRADLLATVADLEARRLQARALLHDRAQQRLSDLGRALPRPERMLEERRQRLDVAIARMPRIFDVLDRYRDRTAKMGDRLPNSLRTAAARGQISLSQQAGRLTPARLTDRIDRCSERLADRSSNLMRSLQILTERNRAKFDRRTARFVPALVTRKFHEQSDHVASLGRTLRTLDHNDILKRGFAILRSSGDVVTTVASVRPGGVLEIELKDGQIAATAGGRPAKPVKTKGAKPSPEGQGSLF